MAAATGAWTADGDALAALNASNNVVAPVSWDHPHNVGFVDAIVSICSGSISWRRMGVAEFPAVVDGPL